MEKAKSIRYFLIAFGWTWLFWMGAIICSFQGFESAARILHYSGGIGPLLSALVMLFYKSDIQLRKDFWKRIIDFKRIPLHWYLVIFPLVPGIMIISAVIDLLSSGSGAHPELITVISQNPGSIFSLVFFYLIFGPIPEESGWCEYALDRLLKLFSANKASFLLGFLWAIWVVNWKFKIPASMILTRRDN